MPLILPEDLLSDAVLAREKIFTMSRARAESQDIRPLKVAIVNLMPNKEETEVQLLKMLTNTPLQIQIDLVHMDSHRSRHTKRAHLERFYKTYDDIKDTRYDGMIITGAPIEKLAYDDIYYWNELKRVFDFAKTNVFSTLFICWSAQAALYYYYGIPNHTAKEKIFGIYHLKPLKDSVLFRGFDDEYAVPQSRHTYVDPEAVEAHEDLELLAADKDVGVALAATKDHRFIFHFGHWEYDKTTLHREYLRDAEKGMDTAPPKNYYEGDDPHGKIKMRWRSSANLFFTNWLNHCVYQQTPYLLGELKSKRVSKFGGTSLSSAAQFHKVKEILKERGEHDVVVVSAPGKRDDGDSKITDRLIDVAKARKDGRREEAEALVEAIKDRFTTLALELDLGPGPLITIERTVEAILKSKNPDFIISRGEFLNAKLLAAYIGYRFVDSKHLLKFRENGEVDVPLSEERIRDHIRPGEQVVVPGFYGSDARGRIRLLPRGGSDYTGSLIAGAIKAAVYENWTDVDGIFDADPKKNREAKAIAHMDYDRLLRIIEDGAGVYQKEAVEPVRANNITVHILNTNRPKASGTIIQNDGYTK